MQVIYHIFIPDCHTVNGTRQTYESCIRTRQISGIHWTVKQHNTVNGTRQTYESCIRTRQISGIHWTV